jgi:hypothetical protein
MKYSAVLKALSIALLLLGSPGSAEATPLHSVADLLTTLQSHTSPLVEPAHCRRYVHTHRRCVRWRRGICRSWRTWRHRC